MSDLIRRDPRAEWIARNRLHPLHAAMQTQQTRWMGPNGLIRKNPHAVGFIGPNGIKRIDRSGVVAIVGGDATDDIGQFRALFFHVSGGFGLKTIE